MSGGGFQVVQNTRPAIRLAHAFQIFRSRFAMSQKLTVNDFKARAVPGLAEVHHDTACRRRIRNFLAIPADLPGQTNVKRRFQ